MSAKFVLRVKKIKSDLLTRCSGQHNFRESVSDNVDPARTANNEVLAGATSADDLERLVKERVAAAGKADAKATRCMELVISASPEVFDDFTFNAEVYFKDALRWCQRLHGAENVVSAVIHNDEDTPHLHVLIVPINQVEEKTRMRSVAVKGGGREVRAFVEPAHTLLSANTVYGGPAKLSALQTAFQREVGARHCLDRKKRFYSGRGGDGYISPRQFKSELVQQAYQLSQDRADLQARAAALSDKEKALTEREGAVVSKEREVACVKEGLDREREALDAAIESKVKEMTADVRAGAVKQKNLFIDAYNALPVEVKKEACKRSEERRVG